MEGKSYENISSSIVETAGGPPDSHEAMNNRMMINPKLREKRSYEFLMGLINNNSKYEVTRVDPSEIDRQPKSKIAASELLLDLMVKIASHPDHWDKVHKLLQKIDNDLMTSKKIVDDLENNNDLPKTDVFKKVEFFPEPINYTTTPYEISKTTSSNNNWPIFDNKEETRHHIEDNKNSSYQKTFAYHRVTRRPSYMNKNPKAYIAVSVIAPKPLQEDDFNLENELHQLKPWYHNKVAKKPVAP